MTARSGGAPSSDVDRLGRPPAPRRAPEARAARPEDCLEPGGVSFAALTTLLGVTVRGGEGASYSFTIDGIPDGAGGPDVHASGTGAYRTVPELAARAVFEEFSCDGITVPGGMEERIVRGLLYVRSGLAGGPDTWLVRPADLGPRGVHLARMLDAARGSDPGAQLRRLVADGTLAEAGAEAVTGVPTTRYAGELPAGPDFPAGIRVEVWIDACAVARRVTALAPTAAGEVGLTLTFADGDGRPGIEVPASF